MNNDMNFNQNNSYGNPLFSNDNTNSNDLENEFKTTESIDMPPELGQIKNLSDATTYQAPTMDALGPANYITQDKLISKDPLDLYENRGVIDNINNYPQENSKSNETEFSNDLDLNFYNNLNNISADSNFSSHDQYKNIYENQELADIKNDIDINSIPPRSLSNNEEIDEKGEDYSKNFDINNILMNSNENRNSYEENISSDKSKDFEIINHSLNNIEDNGNINDDLDEYNSDNNGVLEVEKEPSKDEYKEAIEQEFIPDAKEEDIKTNEESITDIDSLGIDDIYSKTDILDIIDNDLEEESLKLENIDEKSNNDSIEQIKKLVEELKSNGKNIRLEEFDFENMHQLIIVVKK